MKAIITLALLALSVSAEILVLTKTNNPNVSAINIPAGVRVVDMSGNKATRSDDANDVLNQGVQPSHYPAVVDTATKTFICDTTDVSNMLSRLPALVESKRFSLTDADLAINWPLLTEHPSTNEIPANGLAYRLTDGSNITWWIARSPDLLSTQLSSHDENGNPIHRTVNLKTGIQTDINLDAIINTMKPADQIKIRTNKTAKVRGRK